MSETVVFTCSIATFAFWPFPRSRLIFSFKMEQFKIILSYCAYIKILFWHTNIISNGLPIHLIIHSRISKFEAVWINSSSTIVITYKTYWHNDISAVKTLFSQHLFTCNLCTIVWKYDLFGRHVENIYAVAITFILCTSRIIACMIHVWPLQRFWSVDVKVFIRLTRNFQKLWIFRIVIQHYHPLEKILIITVQFIMYSIFRFIIQYLFATKLIKHNFQLMAGVALNCTLCWNIK